MAAIDSYGPVERARSLVGVRFRPQGRSAELGLDCIGLAMLAFGLPANRVRADYRLSGGTSDEIETVLGEFLCRVPTVERHPGDLLLVKPGAGQLHLLIGTTAGYVHSDIRLRRVVEVPGPVPWPVVSAWRREQKGTT